MSNCKLIAMYLSLFCVALIALGPTLLHSSTVFQLCILTLMTRRYTQHVIEFIVSRIDCDCVSVGLIPCCNYPLLNANGFWLSMHLSHPWFIKGDTPLFTRGRHQINSNPLDLVKRYSKYRRHVLSNCRLPTTNPRDET